MPASHTVLLCHPGEIANRFFLQAGIGQWKVPARWRQTFSAPQHYREPAKNANSMTLKRGGEHSFSA
jgi:hypothetical protein